MICAIKELIFFKLDILRSLKIHSQRYKKAREYIKFVKQTILNKKFQKLLH